MRASLPGSRATIVRAVDNSCDTTACTTTDIAVASAGQGTSAYIGGSLPSPVIDDGSGVELLLQHNDPGAVAALRAGQAVTTDPTLVRDGRIALQLTATTTSASGTSTSTDKTIQVNTYVAAEKRAFVQLILPPSLAARLGVKVRADDVFVATAHRPTDREQQAAAGALSKVDPNLRLYVETGYHNPILWMMLALVVGAGIITVGATTIATALSNVDGRPDLTTLGAVGAAPRTRRLLSMSRAGVIAGIGTVLGTAAGFVPSYAWIHSQTRAGNLGLSSVSVYVPGSDSSARLHMVIPWLPIAATAIVVPVVAALLAGAVQPVTPAVRAPGRLSVLRPSRSEQGHGQLAPGRRDPRLVRAEQLEVVDEAVAQGVALVAATSAAQVSSRRQRPVDVTTGDSA